MPIICILHSVFGNLVVIRILLRHRNRALIETNHLTKIGIVFALLISTSTVILATSPRSSLILVVASLFALMTVLQALEARRIQSLSEVFPHFLDRWILNLKIGHAYSSARDRALQNCSSQFQASINPLFKTIEGESRTAIHHPFLSLHTVEELHLIQKQSHNTLARLKNLREHLARESGFRRKSGHALRQAAIQSLVLTLIHLALTAFTVMNSGIWVHFDLILVSTALTFLGVLTLRILARRIKWTI